MEKTDKHCRTELSGEKELSEMTSQPKSTAEMYKTLYIVFANAEQIERIESFSYADKFNLKEMTENKRDTGTDTERIL